MRGKRDARPLELLQGQDGGKSDDQIVALQNLSKQHDQEFHLCGIDKWYFFKHVLTVDEDEGGIIHPFPVNFDGLRYFDYLCKKNQKVIVLKARRQLISWFAMMDMLHDAMFAGTGIPDTYQAFRGAVMTIGEVEAHYLIERATKVYHKLPEWLKARSRLVTDNKLRMEFAPGGIIQAFPMKREGPQSFGFTKALFDEMAMQEAARSTWTGMMPTLGSKGKLLAVSTPNGRSNFFYNVWSNKNEQYKGLCRVSITWKGEVRTHNDRGDIIHTYNPKVQPHDQAWYDAQVGGLDKQMVARMYHLSFAAYAGMPVWGEFDPNMHVSDKVEVLPNTPMLIGWDFGYHYPAVTFWQRNKRDQFIGHMEYEDFDIGFDDFCRNARDFANSFYNRKKQPEIHFSPPDGFHKYHSKSKSGAISDVAEIKKIWAEGGMTGKVQIRRSAQDVGTRDNEGPRLKEVRKLWKLRADGQPGIIIHPNMAGFIEGCGGGYAYDEKGTSEQPDKGEASHKQDSFQSVVTGYNLMSKGNTGNKERLEDKMKKRSRIGRRTGL